VILLLAALLSPAVVFGSDLQPPTCSDDSASVDEDGSTRGQLACTEVDPVTYSLDSEPSHGTAAVDPDGSYAYEPAADFNGSDTFTFIGTDEDGPSAPATISVAVRSVNDPPKFVKGPNQTVAEDTGVHAVSAWASGIDRGAPDELSQEVDFVIDSDNAPALFTVAPAVSPIGTLTYTLAPNANGAATIGLHIHDNGGALNGGDDSGPTVTFTITVTPVNDPPTCADDSNATFVGSRLDGALTTCSDIDGDTLGYRLVTASTHGTTVVDADGGYSYAPSGSFQGTDTFTFKVNDGTVDSNEATMSILVAPDPIARNDVSPADFPAIVQGSGPTAIPVLANDLDKQGGPLLIQSVTQGSKGKVAITGGGTGLTYDPTGLATGPDSFRYTIVDEQSRTNSAIVVVKITPDTTKPVVSVPLVTIVSPSTLGSTTGKVRITWVASDVGTGLKTVRLQQSYRGETFTTVALAKPKASSVLRALAFGKAYRYRVRATDIVGNVSTYVVSPTFVLSRVQESSGQVAYTGGWRLVRSTSYSGGKARSAAASGASAMVSFTGRSVAWVSSKSASRGSAQVYVDGVLARTVSLHRSTTIARQVVFSARWATSGPHTLRIVVVGTAGHPRVDVDTFVVAR
jgi:Bacterial Ig domain